MAIYTTLPIYRVSYELLTHIAKLHKNMQRDFKRSFGDEIKTECVRVILATFRANCAHDKAPHLTELLEHLQVIELFIRLAFDQHVINVEGYAKAIELTESIGKQANGWRNSILAPAA